MYHKFPIRTVFVLKFAHGPWHKWYPQWLHVQRTSFINVSLQMEEHRYRMPWMGWIVNLNYQEYMQRPFGLCLGLSSLIADIQEIWFLVVCLRIWACHHFRNLKWKRAEFWKNTTCASVLSLLVIRYLENGYGPTLLHTFMSCFEPNKDTWEE